MKQEMMGWQWHQLDCMQIISTWLQTDNIASTLSVNFYRLDALIDAQPIVPKTLKAFRSAMYVYVSILRAGVQPTLDPYTEAFL